jgi:acyl-CoA thioesterase FadM
MGVPLQVRARVKEIKGRKVIMDEELIADGQVTARGQVVAVLVPPELMPPSREVSRLDPVSE